MLLIYMLMLSLIFMMVLFTYIYKKHNSTIFLISAIIALLFFLFSIYLALDFRKII